MGEAPEKLMPVEIMGEKFSAMGQQSLVSTLKLTIPDLCLYDSEGRVVFVLEIKINKHDVQQAQAQLNLAVLGNWRKGVLVMAGGICLAGLFTFFLYTLSETEGCINIQKISPTLDLNNESDWKPLVETLLTILSLISS